MIWLMIRTIIIDDEPNIRKGLRALLTKKHENIKIVAEAGDIEMGVEVIEKHQPDLVFLDIELSDGSSFDLLNQLDNINFHIIFITAYESYAIKAFKYSATDYLLKPVIPQELKNALERVEKSLHSKSNQTTIPVLKSNLKSPEKIVLKTLKQYYVIQINKIIRCQADQSYTTFYVQDTSPITISKPLKEYVELLPSDDFMRVHQSHLINCNQVTGYNKEGYIQLSDHSQVPVSTRKKETVISRLFK